jgi:hypothetical protein
MQMTAHIQCIEHAQSKFVRAHTKGQGISTSEHACMDAVFSGRKASPAHLKFRGGENKNESDKNCLSSFHVATPVVVVAAKRIAG